MIVVPTAEVLREIGADAIAVQHRAELLLERPHDGERRLANDLAILAAHERQIVEPRHRRRPDVRAVDRTSEEARLVAAQRRPLVRERRRITADRQWELDLLTG